jgi:hypothetical protein
MTRSGDDEARAEFVELLSKPPAADRFEALDATLTGNVIDGVPVCSATIGALMTRYADAIEASLDDPDPS